MTGAAAEHNGGGKGPEEIRMSECWNLTLPADEAEIRRLAEWLETLAAGRDLSPLALQQLELALEEVLTNIVWYGGEAARGHPIQMRVDLTDGLMTIEIADRGQPFDPLAAPEPDFDLDAEDRAPGGLGIHLVRNLTDSVSYRRDGETNLLVLTKTVALAAAQPENETQDEGKTE